MENLTYDEIDYDDGGSERPNDMAETVIGFMSGRYIKMIAIIFIVFLLVNSEVFIDKVLGRVDGSLDHRAPTTKGVIIQATCLCLIFIFVDVGLRLLP